jgi:NifU-like protein involved in Fe-S cluster formation
MVLEDLYQEIILDHYKNPRNKGVIENPDFHRHARYLGISEQSLKRLR